MLSTPGEKRVVNCFQRQLRHPQIPQITQISKTYSRPAEPGAKRSGATGSTLNNTQRSCTCVLLGGIQWDPGRSAALRFCFSVATPTCRGSNSRFEICGFSALV